VTTTSAGPTTPPKAAYTPAQIQSIYGFNTLFANSAANNLNAGAGTTIAIVDAYDYPTVQHDMDTFSAQFGLPSTTVTRVNQTGGTALPGTDPTGGWELEEALDVQWAHAIAPAAKILLVEARSASDGDLLAAVDTARSTPGVVAVSMSWGGGEFPGQQSDDAHFTSPTSNPGVAFFAASGDSGYGPEWPASSANVVAVGGTSLSFNATTGKYTETAWSGSGGGASAVVSKPSYQAGYTGAGSTLLNGTSKRGTPDVSLDADPNSGVAVFDSFSTTTTTGFGRFHQTTTQVYNWIQVGGTSASTPMWAGLTAIADGLRGPGKSLDGASQLLPALYALGSNGTSYGANFIDITSGSTGRSTLARAGTGYDFTTGLGSPNAANLVGSLARVQGSGSTITFTATVATSSSNSSGVTPHAIAVVPVTIISIPVVLSPSPTFGTGTGNGSGTATGSPSGQSSSTAPGTTQPVSVVVVTLSPVASVRTSAAIVLLSPITPSSLPGTGNAAVAHGSTSAVDPGIVGGSVLGASSSTPGRPAQPLFASPAFDRIAPLRLHEEQEPLVPIEWEMPALGWDWDVASLGDPGMLLDLAAIARRAAELGRVPDLGGSVDAVPAADGPGEPLPMATDLNGGPRAATPPPVDPVLAGVVVTVGGALALKVDRPFGGRRRRPAAFRTGR
jgi:hypothetical protein